MGEGLVIILLIGLAFVALLVYVFGFSNSSGTDDEDEWILWWFLLYMMDDNDRNNTDES